MCSQSRLSGPAKALNASARPIGAALTSRALSAAKQHAAWPEACPGLFFTLSTLCFLMRRKAF
jgi:hypothetical protein